LNPLIDLAKEIDMADIDDLTHTNTEKPDAPEGKEDNTEHSKGIDYEALARPMGWRPEAEYKGPKDKFVDAQTFYENGEKVLPIVNAANKELRREVERLTAQHREFAKIAEQAHARDRAEWEAQLANAKTIRAKAITEGDGEAHEVADEAVKELEKKLTAPPPKKTDEAPPLRKTLNPANDPILNAWLDEHPRAFEDQDFAMQLAAVATLSKFNPIRNTQRTFYDAVYKEALRIERLAAEEDTDGRERPGPAKGNRGNDEVGGNRGAPKRSYENLTPEFKRTCDRMGRDYGKTSTPAEKAKWQEYYVQGCTDEAFK
jgi:hypothetical protein